MQFPETRLEAAARGEKRYKGEPCAQGHEGLRYTSSGSCVECSRLAARSRAEKIRRLLHGEQDA